MELTGSSKATEETESKFKKTFCLSFLSVFFFFGSQMEEEKETRDIKFIAVIL